MAKIMIKISFLVLFVDQAMDRQNWEKNTFFSPRNLKKDYQQKIQHFVVHNIIFFMLLINAKVREQK